MPWDRGKRRIPFREFRKLLAVDLPEQVSVAYLQILMQPRGNRAGTEQELSEDFRPVSLDEVISV
jgi:hypothetical protein